ncbi:MAG: thioredoxin domain-containing protein [Erythrobacter sp.]
MKLSRRFVSFAFAAPLALALAACNGSDDPEGGVDGDPIAAIPAPEGQEWTDIVTITENGGYQLGNPEAPLKLVEYASHTCGACANFAATGAAPIKADYVSTGVVSFELRNLVRDPIDLTIATLVRCGAKENMHPLADQAWGSFQEVIGAAQAGLQQVPDLGNQPPEQRFVTIGEAGGLIDFFSARGLSADQSRACLADSERVEAIAEASQQQAEELNVTATPTFFLNGRKLDSNSWNQLEPELQRAGAR